MTEKFNSDKNKAIGMKTWEKTYMRACTTEWNNKVDLHLWCNGKEGIIEVKSFTDSRQAKEGVTQAATYAARIGLDVVTLVLFVPLEDNALLENLSGEKTAENVRVTVCAIGWA